jgi:malate dehydrogenase
MREVAIIGAGELGGELAHVLARLDLVRTIRLIDANAPLAAGKALDIMQAAPIERYATSVAGGSDPSEAAGAEVIVIADEPGDDAGLKLLKRLAISSQRAPIVCAGASHCTLVESGVRERAIGRTRLLGSAPEALSAALRALVALEADTSPQNVALVVLGRPPGHIVVPWEDAAIGGLSAARVLDATARRRLAARAAPLWPPGPYALANAAAAAVKGLLGQSRRQLSVFVGPDESGGRRTRAAALPVRLGRGGIEVVVTPALNVNDQVALDNAMML